MGLFKKKYLPEPTDIVYEKWHSSFSIFHEHRFIPEESEGYRSYFERGSFCLDIKRKNLFVWTDDPLYRYDNFLLNAELGIKPGNGYSAAGFLFRKIEDLSYYYFLISSMGHFRCDLVLNGMPSVLIDWTECPEFSPDKFKITISADGGHLSFFLNGSWLGNVSDESVDAGGIAFAGQNYNEADTAGFSLFGIDIESRPAELEVKRERIRHRSITEEAQLRFIESRVRSGHHGAALIEIRKVIKDAGASGRLLLTAADCCINLEMFDEAAAYLEKIPEDERDERYILQKAGLLYRTNEFILLRDFLKSRPEFCEGNSVAANLLGNAEYALGNWRNAADSYSTAFTAENIALYAFNTARALEKTGDRKKAAEMYGSAARMYFRNGEYDQLAGLLPYLEALDSADIETVTLRAKLLFQEENFEAAGRIFSDLIRKKTGDSSVYYLNALIESKNGNRKSAVKSFEKAAELEPDFYLYHFKYAEYLFVTEGDYRPSLDAALRLAPDDAWVLNLAGLAAVGEERTADAVELFEKAAAAAPEEEEIRVNRSEALFLSGDAESAMALLTGDSPEILNQRGNINARLHNYGSAVSDYEAAYAADRNRPDIILNLAAACIESDSFSRAEELLVRVLDFGENAHAYNLLGNLAMLKGEYGRAEAAYRRAVETEPGYTEAVCNLAELYVSRGKLNDADILLGTVKSENPGERFDALKQTVFRKRMHVFSCSSCRREWVVPKKIGAQPALKLVGEPPDEMPAGKCTSCGDVYCIGCAKEKLNEGRLVCLSCGAPLKLSEDWIRYLYHDRGY